MGGKLALFHLSMGRCLGKENTSNNNTDTSKTNSSNSSSVSGVSGVSMSGCCQVAGVFYGAELALDLKREDKKGETERLGRMVMGGEGNGGEEIYGNGMVPENKRVKFMEGAMSGVTGNFPQEPEPEMSMDVASSSSTSSTFVDVPPGQTHRSLVRSALILSEPAPMLQQHQNPNPNSYSKSNITNNNNINNSNNSSQTSQTQTSQTPTISTTTTTSFSLPPAVITGDESGGIVHWGVGDGAVSVSVASAIVSGMRR